MDQVDPQMLEAGATRPGHQRRMVWLDSAILTVASRLLGNPAAQAQVVTKIDHVVYSGRDAVVGRPVSCKMGMNALGRMQACTLLVTLAPLT